MTQSCRQLVRAEQQKLPICLKVSFDGAMQIPDEALIMSALSIILHVIFAFFSCVCAEQRNLNPPDAESLVLSLPEDCLQPSL